MSDELFTTRMRKATRKAHAASDALVNAKLLFALNNEKVWAEGLLIFYEIFKFLEFAMKEKKNENLGKLYLAEMSRTPAFEADLGYYFGENWKNGYEVRESVKNYLNHLKYLLENDPDLLMVYVYHLYMGLLSGGQILRKKRQLQSKIMQIDENDFGKAVTRFDTEKISELKRFLKENMNSIAETLDEDKKKLLVEESIKVFELNNSIIRTVRDTEKIVLQNIITILSCFIVLVAIFYYFYKLLFSV